MNFSPLEFFRRMREMRDRDRALAEENPFLMQAMEQEKKEGQRLAFKARTTALVIIMFLIPFLNPNWNVLFYEFVLLLFIGIGWMQYRAANVGYSKSELRLIMLDIVLLTAIFTIPNPFLREEIPTAYLYRFDNFIYYFIFLAVGMLAYSWRTVWAMGVWIATSWLIGAILVSFFGTQIEGLGEAISQALVGYNILADELNPNAIQWNIRSQEIIVLLIVAAILAIKGFRSNELLVKQANIAAERANLSRYFPSSIVDTLASTDRDIGAVKSQHVVVLFTDIVGFTKYAERNEPEEVMDLLRQYHKIIEACVFENNGTLEKYIGDGVMATFGRPENSDLDAANALAAAQDILNKNEILNKAREAEGKEPVKISLGIHYGPVILGDIGPERQLEFAVVGDTVNVAARLEAESRPLNCRCVVSDEVFKHIDEDLPDRDTIIATFKSKGSVQLRGRTQPIDVWIA